MTVKWKWEGGKKANSQKNLRESTIWEKCVWSWSATVAKLVGRAEKRRRKKKPQTAHPPESIWVLGAGMVCHHQFSGRRKENTPPATTCVTWCLHLRPSRTSALSWVIRPTASMYEHVHGTKYGVLTPWLVVLRLGQRRHQERAARMHRIISFSPSVIWEKWEIGP